MKRALLFFLTLLIWFLAGLYRSPVLMALALAQLLLYGGMGLLSCCLKRRISAGFVQKFTFLSKDHLGEHILWIENRGKIPAGPAEILLYIQAPGGSRTKQKLLIPALDSNARHEAALPLDKPRCGIYTLERGVLRVWDYLRLFRREKRLAGEAQIAVLPSNSRQIMMLPPDHTENQRGDGFVFPPFSGNNRDEIRQLREYRPGDPSRFIHWKLSARLDEFLVREYAREQEAEIPLYLQMSFDKIQPQVREAFYEILYGLLLGMRENGSRAAVCWREKNNRTRQIAVDSLSSCAELFVRLYQSEQELDNTEEPESAGLRFGTDLRLMDGDRLLFQFSAEQYQEEVNGSDFTGSRCPE